MLIHWLFANLPVLRPRSTWEVHCFLTNEIGLHQGHSSVISMCSQKTMITCSWLVQLPVDAVLLSEVSHVIRELASWLTPKKRGLWITAWWFHACYTLDVQQYPPNPLQSSICSSAVVHTASNTVCCKNPMNTCGFTPHTFVPTELQLTNVPCFVQPIVSYICTLKFAGLI